MADPLFINEIDPIQLDGSLDAAGALQLSYASDSLTDHDQTLHAEHADLPTGVVRIKLMDFSVATVNWQLDATHLSSGTTVTWSRGSDHAYYDFGSTSELDVDLIATNNESSAQTKTRKIIVKVSPPDAMPDRPR